MSETESASTVIGSFRILDDGKASRETRRRHALRYLFGVPIVACISLAIVLRWGGYWLVYDDFVRMPVEAAIVPQGSILGEQARVVGAVRFLHDGKTDKILISVPRESYWGQPIAPIARAYIEKKFGIQAASRVEFCEMDVVDSTEQEAGYLLECIEAHHWNSIAIVTSNYHARRTGIIWRRLLQNQRSSLAVVVHAVQDPEFHPAGWWLDRRSAKTWLLESTKLLWTWAGW